LEAQKTQAVQDYGFKGNKSLQLQPDGSETIWGLKALDEFFKNYSVLRITSDAADEFKRKRMKEGAANGTVDGSLALLRRMLSIAYDAGKINRKPKVTLLKPGRARQGFLKQDKFDELLGHIPLNLKLIVFLYYCGVRLGEALAIEWTAVDLQVGVIRLLEGETKNDDPRTIPIPDALIAMLERRKSRTGKVFDATNLRKEWHKACVAAGLGTLTEVEGKPDPVYTRLIIHDLRRSAIRNLIRAGSGEKTAMAISGHKTLDVFYRCNIIDETDVVQAMRRVQEARLPSSASSVRVPRSRRGQKP
jgi:integrase